MATLVATREILNRAEALTVPVRRVRVESVDLLRGSVMICMAVMRCARALSGLSLVCRRKGASEGGVAQLFLNSLQQGSNEALCVIPMIYQLALL
jgi:hypothetical protein